MNYFFGLNSSKFKSDLTIPKFQNNSKKNQNLYPCEAYILENQWFLDKSNFSENENFFFIDSNEVSNEKIYFLSNENEIQGNKKSLNELQKMNNFTNTFPAFRSNLRVKYNNLGFSSYQSEYPFEMTKKNGNVLSPIYPLLNIDAESNYILFRNIFKFPLREKFQIHFINIENKSIVQTTEAFTNFSNLIFVKKELINKEIYIFSEKFIGIPIFISIRNNHISMEHTHPPHHYILSQDKYKTVSRIKNEIKKNIFTR